MVEACRIQEPPLPGVNSWVYIRGTHTPLSPPPSPTPGCPVQIVGAADNRDYKLRAPVADAVTWVKAIRSALQILKLAEA